MENFVFFLALKISWFDCGGRSANARGGYKHMRLVSKYKENIPICSIIYVTDGEGECEGRGKVTSAFLIIYDIGLVTILA